MLLFFRPDTTVDPAPTMTYISSSFTMTHLATSCPSRIIAFATSGFISKACPTAQLVHFTPYSLSNLRIRHTPAREPYSYSDSILTLRFPLKGSAPGPSSLQMAQDSESPLTGVVSEPSS